MIKPRHIFCAYSLLFGLLSTLQPSATYANTPSGKSSNSQKKVSASGISPLPIVYSNTNLPQITNISSTAISDESNFVVSVSLDMRIHRNTVTSISIGLAQKTSQGAFVDPIFQAPCTPLSTLSAKTTNNFGESTALRSRSLDGDWYVENYLIQSTSKLGTSQIPCLGTYLVTSISLVDAAKHTLNVSANLASTTSAAQLRVTPSPSQNRSTQQNSNQASIKYTDTAIMKSNVWNSRLDVAPCTPGTNLAATTTTTVVNGRSTQTIKEPTIIPTDRVACTQFLNFDFSRPLFVIQSNTAADSIIGSGTGTTLRLFDSLNDLIDDEELNNLKEEISTLKKKNKALNKELNALKKAKSTSNPNAIVKPKPTTKPNSSGSDWKIKKPNQNSSQTNGSTNQNWKRNRSQNPTPAGSPTPSSK
jgi:hypothetical protein